MNLNIVSTKAKESTVIAFDKLTFVTGVLAGAVILSTKSVLLGVSFAVLLLLSPPSVIKRFIRIVTNRLFIPRAKVAPVKTQDAPHRVHPPSEYVLSIIIPYTKLDFFTLRLANQIANLDLNSVEVIWVLNSEDDSRGEAELLRPFRASGWRILWEPRLGAGVARNRGIKEARGEFLWFVDSDDELRLESWALLKNELTKNIGEVDLILLGAEDLEFGSQTPRKPDWFLRSTVVSGLHFSTNFRENLFQITQPAAWNKIFRASLVKDLEIEFSQTQTVNDLAFTYMNLAAAKKLLVLSDNIFYRYHRDRPGSLQAKDFSLGDRLAAVTRLGGFLLKSGLLFRFSKSFWRLFVQSFKIAVASSNSVAPISNLHATHRATPTISVIIPVFNSQKYIASTIESVQRQTIRPREILVINDGSTDQSRAIVERLSRTDSSIKLVDCENSGLSAARNRGIDEAKSEYLIFLDSDDILEPSCIESCLDSVSTTGAELVLFDTVAFADPEFANESDVRSRAEELGTFYNRNVDSILLSGPDLLFYFLTNSSYLQSACLYALKKETLAVSGIRFLEGVLMEDNLFTPQLLISSKSAFYTGKKLHRRRVRPDSLSFRRSIETTISNLRVIQSLHGWSARQGIQEGVPSERLIVLRLVFIVVRDFTQLGKEDQKVVLAESGFRSQGKLVAYLAGLGGSIG